MARRVLLGKAHQTAGPKSLIGALGAAIVAGRDGDHVRVAGVAVVADAFVAIAGGEEHQHPLPFRPLLTAKSIARRVESGSGTIWLWVGSAGSNQSPSGGPQLHEITSAPFCAAHTNASASACDPSSESRRMGMSWAIGATPDAPKHALGTGHARAGGAVVVAVTRPRVVGLPRDIARGHDLARRAKLLVIEVDAIIDDRDDRPGPVAQRPGRPDAGMCIDHLPSDGGFRPGATVARRPGAGGLRGSARGCTARPTAL